MKNLILMILFSISASAQLNVPIVEKATEIGKIAPMGMFLISLEKTNDTYTVSYKDQKFVQITDIKSFSFKDENNAFEDLYAMILKGFDTMPTDDTMLELGGKHVWLHYEKSLGYPVFRFAHAVDVNANVIGFTQLLSKKQVIKLFGKKV